MRRIILSLLAAMLLAGAILVAAPTDSRAAPAQTRTGARQAVDPIIGNWYRGKMWFRVRGPFGTRYRVAWSNGSGALIRYTIKKRYAGLYYETANHRNTYRLLNGYTVRVHYQTTGGGYVSRNFARVE